MNKIGTAIQWIGISEDANFLFEIALAKDVILSYTFEGDPNLFQEFEYTGRGNTRWKVLK